MRPTLPRGLYAIADAGFGDPAAIGQSLFAAGCPVVQLRAKTWSRVAVIEAARALVQLADRHSALLIVNDDPVAARESGAHGVHLGQDDGDILSARGIVGEHALIGLSTHSLEQVRRAVDVDYIGFGPIFDTHTKVTDRVKRGTTALQSAVQASAVPVVAIGGIRAENLDYVHKTGCHGWAVISALLEATSLTEAINALQR